MAIKVNSEGVEYAKSLIQARRIDREKNNWEEQQPLAPEADTYILQHGIKAYAKWFLAVNTDHPADTKEHYEFPYGDFNKVYRSALLAAEKRAGQYKHPEVEKEAKELLKLIG